MTHDARDAEEEPTLREDDGRPDSIEHRVSGRVDPPGPADDGEVPPKQIHRWKGEGGAHLPTD